MAEKIMIQTKEKTFFVHKKNLPLLIEFAKTFKATLALVEVSGSEMTDLQDLPTKFCDQNFETPEIDYELIQRLYPDPNTTKQKTRSQMIADAKKIKQYIRERINKKGSLSLIELKEQFKDLCVTDSCLSNHFTAVRKELKKQGCEFEKPKKGTYELVQPSSS